ncbi:MAG: hypothetical protein FGF51_02145 [Candidatus Brockarchaeota archaeon]|nr:hypothetical protein [Candidatus Brockarchaeota archaeon]
MDTRKGEGREQGVTVWYWGEEFKDVGRNCEKYVSKRWDESVKECGVWILARERREGIIYTVTAFVSSPKGIDNLAQHLFNVTLLQGSTKVDFVVVQLTNSVFSASMQYRDPMEKVENELEELMKNIAEKFGEDPRVREVMKGKKVVFIPEICLLCELESHQASKILIEVVHHFFSNIKGFLDSLTNKLIKEGLAERILGYKLNVSVENLEIEDVEAWEDEVHVWLDRI